MRQIPRLFVDTALENGAEFELDGNQVHYLATVLRLDRGAELRLLDDRTGEWAAEITDVGRRRVGVRIGAMIRGREETPDLWLLTAPIKELGLHDVRVHLHPEVDATIRLNVARSATLKAAITEATKRVEEMRVKSDDDRRRLMEFRLQNRTIDPVVLVGLNVEFTKFLRSMQASEEIRLAEIEASVTSEHELTRGAEDRLSAIRAYLGALNKIVYEENEA